MWMNNLEKAIESLEKFFGYQVYDIIFSEIKPVYKGILFITVNYDKILWSEETNSIIKISEG